MDLNWFAELEARIPKGGVRTRFAPSPTGYMHVGNLRTALYTWLIARHSGGTFILRIEDTDQGRLVEGATEVIYATLRKCGLTWDEGPDIGGPVGPYVQTERRGLYANFARLLVEKGHAYYCFCGKNESEEDSGEFDRADDPCRALSPEEAQARVDAGEPYVIRQKIPHGGQTTFSDAVFGDITVDNDTLDDQVLLKSDGLPTYNFANVIDDHLMGITHVVRGSEYLSSAPKYNLLYEAFGWEVPTYIHCSPVMRDQHNKMSKRKGDPSYEDLIAMGYLSEAVVNYVTLLGWSPRGEYAEREFFTLAELSEIFDIGGISKSPAIFDIEKLTYFNAHYIREMSPQDFHAAALPYIKQAGGDQPRLLHGGDRRPAPGPVREAHRHPGEAGLLRRPARVRGGSVHQQEVQDQPGGVPEDAGGRHPRPGGPGGLDDGRHPRHADRPGRVPGGQERHPHVAGAHRRGGQGGHPRRRGGDLPHPGPRRVPAPPQPGPGQAERELNRQSFPA